MGTDRERRASIILGLTGPIGCGKTTVGDILVELGALERIDADEVVHELMRPGTVVTARIAAAFGEAVIAPDGSVDRARLGEIVFGDETKLRQLESIVHPSVRELVRERLRELRDHPGVVVIDAVRLLQSELADLCDEIWVVRCNPKVEMERLRSLRQLTQEQAFARLHAQPSFDDPRVTRVIDNSRSLADLQAQVREAFSPLSA